MRSNLRTLAVLTVTAGAMLLAPVARAESDDSAELIPVDELWSTGVASPVATQ